MLFFISLTILIPLQQYKVTSNAYLSKNKKTYSINRNYHKFMQNQSILLIKLTGVQNSQKMQVKSKYYTCFHNLIVSPTTYEGQKSIARDNFIRERQEQEEGVAYVNPKTSFHLCKIFKGSTQFEELQSYVIKRLSYRSVIKEDQMGRKIYNDPQSKNIDQITTEYQCLTLMNKSHRVIRMVEMIHQNTISKQDNKFFYHFLRLPDRRSQKIRNICFILEEMNQGSLKEQIENIIVKKQQPFLEETIIQFTCQIAQGILELRKKGIIHRDLRPQNLLFNNGQIKFADFDSAFIRGYSTYQNIKNGIDMKQTTPLQIMMLIAESDQKLSLMSSEQLYKIQQKADIYFLGVNMFTMIFSQYFQSFNGGRILRSLINIKKREGFNPKVLDLMQKCLEKDSHRRIGFQQVISTLSQVQREAYLSSQSYNKTYLSEQPLNLYSFSSNQLQAKLQSQKDPEQLQSRNNKKQMDDEFEQSLKRATLDRFTDRYQPYVKLLFRNQLNMERIWVNNQKTIRIHQLEKNLQGNVQQFLTKMNIKAFYYEFIYRKLCDIELKQIKIPSHKQNIRIHLQIFCNQLVVILTFIYQMMVKCSFTSDKHYITTNYTYQNRKVLTNLRNLLSRKDFFVGRKKLMAQKIEEIQKLEQKLIVFQKDARTAEQQEALKQIKKGFSLIKNSSQKIKKLQKLISQFKLKQYKTQQQRMDFSYQYAYLCTTFEKMQIILKEQMVQTIINLILAYQQIKLQAWGHFCNIKNVIFMMMILEVQDTNKMNKNDMVIIEAQLSAMSNNNLGWKSQQLQSFFNNYTNMNARAVSQGLNEMQSHAALRGDTKLNIQQPFEQQNEPHMVSAQQIINNTQQQSQSPAIVIHQHHIDKGINQSGGFVYIIDQSFPSKNCNNHISRQAIQVTYLTNQQRQQFR